MMKSMYAFRKIILGSLSVSLENACFPTDLPGIKDVGFQSLNLDKVCVYYCLSSVCFLVSEERSESSFMR